MNARSEGFSAPDEGELVPVDVDGRTVTLTSLEGRLHAFDDVCPHAGCSLAEGELDGSTVTYSCHFAKFDIRTGAVLGGPARTGLATWPVRCEGGRLDLGERQDPPAKEPDAPEAVGSDSPDVAELVEREHDAFRRQFASLASAEDPVSAWAALSEVLEVHARAEETLLYPVLVSADSAATAEAVRDHNRIRTAVDRVQEQEAGRDSWHGALREARRVTEDHLAEEERDLLPDLRARIGVERSSELGARSTLGRVPRAFQGARGLTGDAVDPAQVVPDWQ